MENQDKKLLWDFNIGTVCVMEARRSDIVLIFQKNRETIIIDVAIPGEFRFKNKEAQKISKYQDSALEICRTLNTKNRVNS